MKQKLTLRMKCLNNNQGSALILTIMVMMLMSILGATLLSVSLTSRKVNKAIIDNNAAWYEEQGKQFAQKSGLEQAMVDIIKEALEQCDWSEEVEGFVLIDEDFFREFEICLMREYADFEIDEPWVYIVSLEETDYRVTINIKFKTDGSLQEKGLLKVERAT